MLILSRKKSESLIIDENIIVTVVDIRGDKVRLGIDAPREMPVQRQEVYEAVQREAVPRSTERPPEKITPPTKTQVNLDVYQVEFLDKLVSQISRSFRLWPPGRAEIIETLIDSVIAMDVDLSNVQNLDQLKQAIVGGYGDSDETNN